ncbi:hypothetical protein [Paraburkholderia nemoris]|uniref:hypothetical protein n=1 Tax=Paraburkholderia nemoris TaxID=2793076 RepID=UPI001B20875A|nr:hypothetical protein [Paraburkholderia nemoris]CAE6848995.1 hypothetical protein LMG22931_07605 [Paraburkholderia nemoris]
MTPFNADNLYHLYDQFHLPPQTREMIGSTLRRRTPLQKAPLQRTVGSMVCPKMGIEIRSSDKTTQRPAILKYIFDETVQGYIDSPFEINIRYEGRNGRCTTHNFTPHFLEWGSDGFWLEDWFSPEKYAELVRNNPMRYVYKNGKVHSPAAELAAEKMGLRYRIRSTEEITETEVRNWDYLRSYLSIPKDTPNTALKAMRDRFTHDSFCSLKEIINDRSSQFRDGALRAVAHQQVIADFSLAFAGNADRFILYRDESVRDLYRRTHYNNRPKSLGSMWDVRKLRPGGTILYLGEKFMVIALAEQHLILKNDSGGDPVEFSNSFVERAYLNGTLNPLTEADQVNDPLVLDSPFRHATPKAVQHAIKIQGLYRRWINGERSTDIDQYSDRTYRTYRKRERVAVAEGKDRLVAFLPQNHKRGSRAPKLSAEVDKIIRRVFEENYETLTAPNRWSVYGTLRQELSEHGLPSPSKGTFLKRLRRETSHESTARRLGYKTAYQEKPFAWSLSRETPRHGDYPMQCVHIDHTQLQIVVRSVLTGEVLDKPWLTLVFCAYSRRVVGFHLSMRAPSYHSDMCAIFDTIRRVGRAPDTLIVDWGRDFQSLDFDTFADVLESEILRRPKSAPRSGCVLERMFGISQTELIDNLPGNTKILRNPRLVTPQSDPFKLAALTLVDLYEGLEEYFTIYHETRHPALLITPLCQYSKGLDMAGQRLHRLKRESDLIPVALPSVRGQTRVLDAQRGVRVDRQYYRNPLLERQHFHKQCVPVKSHLLYPETVFALVDDTWYPMYSDRFGFLLNESSYFRRAALSELLLLNTWVDRSKLSALERRTALVKRLVHLAQVGETQHDETIADGTPHARPSLVAIPDSPEVLIQRQFARAFLELQAEEFDVDDSIL